MKLKINVFVTLVMVILKYSNEQMNISYKYVPLKKSKIIEGVAGDGNISFLRRIFLLPSPIEKDNAGKKACL